MPLQSSRISPRRVRPRQAQASSRPSGRSDVARHLGQHVLGYVASWVLEHYAMRSQEQTQQEGRQDPESQGHGTGQIFTDILFGQLLEEVIQYLIRHNFFRHRRHQPRTPSARNMDIQRETSLNSQSSCEQRRRYRHRRRTDIMIASLGRLSTELEVTHIALLRLLHSPRNIHPVEEPLITNANNLKRAITRSTAMIESVRQRCRRESRQLSGHGRAARGNSGTLSRSSSQLPYLSQSSC